MLLKLKKIKLIKGVNDGKLVQVLLLVLFVALATNDKDGETGFPCFVSLLRTVRQVEEVHGIALREAGDDLSKAVTVVLESVVSVPEGSHALTNVAFGGRAQKEFLQLGRSRGKGVHFHVQRI